MKRVLAMMLVTCLTALSGVALGQEPPGGEEPVLLKKKKKSGAVEKGDPEKPAKKEDKQPTDEEKEKEKDRQKAAKENEPVDDGADEREVLERIARNVKLAEERLANRELGDGTRQVQEDVLKDIDSLIKKASQPPEGGGGGDGSQDQNQQGQAGKRGGKSSSARSSGGKSGSRGGQQQRGHGQMSKGKGGSQPKGGPDGKGDKPMGKGVGKGQEGPPNRAADLYKDIWGHLPESLRGEMNAYFNDKQFMAKYDDLIKRYYSAIAEKGRRKER